MYSTVHTHMDTCSFKREQVICSDNVWLSEVMLGNRCGARVHGVPHGRFQDSKRDFLKALAGGITPQQSASIHKIFTRNTQDFPRFTQESHKKSTRITLESHKIFTRIPSVLTRISHDHSTENSRNNFRFPCENTRIRMSHW